MDSMPDDPRQKKQNFAEIVDEVMTVTIFLDGDAGMAKALGALEMAKDNIKAYYTQNAMLEAQRKNRIIRPGLAN